MRRHAGQKALYEAMSRPRSKPRRVGLLQRLRPQLEKLREAGVARVKRSLSRPEPAAEKPPPMVLKPPKPREVSEPAAQSPVQTWLRPKAVQWSQWGARWPWLHSRGPQGARLAARPRAQIRVKTADRRRCGGARWRAREW